MAFRSTLDPAHVEREILQVFSRADQQAALTALDGVRDLGWDVVWVKLAVISLSGGSLSLLPQWISLANQDSRDFKMATESQLDWQWDAKYQRPVS